MFVKEVAQSIFLALGSKILIWFGIEKKAV